MFSEGRLDGEREGVRLTRLSGLGTGAAGVPEMEVVTADGRLLTANAWQHPDLFWALRGGGGGTFGVVTRTTLATHPLPSTFGAVFRTLRAADDAELRKLVERFCAFFRGSLDDEHTGAPAGERPAPRDTVERIGRAMAILREATPQSGTYPNEADYLEPDWQRSFWGVHYPRLLRVKESYDPLGLFHCHHAVGSEGWSLDQMTRS